MEIHQIVKLFDTLKSARGTLEQHWQELADRFLPAKNRVTEQRMPGQKLKTTNYDSTAMDSLVVFAAGMHSYLTNPSAQWFELAVDDENLNDNKDVKMWLKECSDIIYRTLNKSNFNQQIHETYLDFGCFGTAFLYEDEDAKDFVRFYARPPAECYVMENEREVIDTMIRRCSMDVRQAHRRWGTNAGQKVLEKVKEGKWNEKIEVLHSVMPREKYDSSKQDAGNKPYESVYIEKDQKHKLSESGYEEFPFFCPRMIKVSGEVYGYSQTMVALPDVKTLNAMSKTILKAAQKQVDPPIVVPDDGYILPFRTTAGAVNYKQAGIQDEIEVLKTEVKGSLPVGLEMEDQRRQQIRRALFVDLFLMLANMDSKMTATEVRERVNEKMLILGPILGRLMNELLDPLIHRTFSILRRLGKLPPVPSVLLNTDTGGMIDLSIVYVSPLAKAQRMTEAQSINDFLVTVSEINLVAPMAVDNIDIDKTVKRLADIYNVPADILNSDERVDEIRKTRLAAQEAQRQMNMIQQGAESAETLTRAESNLKAKEG